MIAKRTLSLIATVAVTTPLWAEPPSPASIRGLIRSANRAYERQDFEEAIRTYATLPPTPERPAEICFNEGLAYAGMDDADRASEAFRMADLNASDPKLRGDARFNLARLRYDAAIAAAANEPESAITELRETARVFRSVLEVNPGDREAARNVERSRLAIRAIQEEMKRQREAQEQRQSQMNDMAQQLQQLAERQQQAADQSQSAEEQMQQDSAVGAEASRQSQENQRPISEETQELMEQLRNMLGNAPQNDPSQTDVSEVLGKMKEARDGQGQAESELSKARPGEAEESQREAAEDLAEAARRLQEASKGGGDQPQDEPSDGQDGEDRENEQAETTESRPREVRRLGRADGDPIAKQLLEKEIMDRVNRVRRGPLIPSDKDW